TRGIVPGTGWYGRSRVATPASPTTASRSSGSSDRRGAVPAGRARPDGHPRGHRGRLARLRPGPELGPGGTPEPWGPDRRDPFPRASAALGSTPTLPRGMASHGRGHDAAVDPADTQAVPSDGSERAPTPRAVGRIRRRVRRGLG